MTSNQVFSVYRNLIRYAKNLSTSQQKIETLAKIKSEFRLHRNEQNVEKIQEMIKKAESSLSYLKIITPKRFGGQQGYTKITFGENKIQDGGRAVSNWTGNNMDPDSVKRHYVGLKRAGFRDNSHAKGYF